MLDKSYLFIWDTFDSRHKCFQSFFSMKAPDLYHDWKVQRNIIRQRFTSKRKLMNFKQIVRQCQKWAILTVNMVLKEFDYDKLLPKVLQSVSQCLQSVSTHHTRWNISISMPLDLRIIQDNWMRIMKDFLSSLIETTVNFSVKQKCISNNIV